MEKWRKYNGALVPLIPPHLKVDASGVEKIIKETNSYFARWTSNFDSKKETDFWFVICDEFATIDRLSRSTRSKVRRGLKNCSIQLIRKSRIEKEGFYCYTAAFLNYNTHLKPSSIVQFKKELRELEGDWEFWGVYHEEKMIGYSQNKIVDDYCDYSTIKFHPNFLKFYPSYALFYTMNQYYLGEKKVKYVNDGARSISHETNIQDFLIQKFQFRKAFCKLHIQYSPKVKLLLLVLYPFRSLIFLLRFGIFKKINILLFQEKIRRSYE